MLAAAVAASAAGAAGGPTPGIAYGWDGVRADTALRYVTLPGMGSTAVSAIRTRDGRVLRYGTLAGELGIPLVAFDGTAGGLSHDGATLVLASWTPQFTPDTKTTFAVLGTRSLREKQRFELPGLWAFDALSPDGSTIFAVRYLSPSAPDRYEVRAIDARTGTVAAGAIVDKREPDEEMRGQPLSRTTDVAGRWAYTLYGKPDGTGFVHALDTVKRAAACIDLPWHGVQDALWGVRMSVDRGGTTLTLHQQGRGRLAVVDLKGLAVRAFKAPVAVR
jgi:hypothetical protein